MINKWSMKEIILWSTPLKNGGAHPLFYGGMRTHYFMGACALIILGARRALIFKRARRALIFKRAQALIVQRQTSKEQLQSGHERISSWNALLKKWVRAHPLFLGARRAPIILGARRAPILKGARALTIQKGHKHSLFKGKQAKSNCKVDMKE